MQLDIKLKSGMDFVSCQPVKLTYSLSFANRCDYLLYEVDLYDKMNFKPDEEFTFAIQPDEGVSVKFVGILYDIKTVKESTNVRFYFVSKYLKKLDSNIPLYGKGNLVNVMTSFYRKASVPKIESDSTNISMENIWFPRTVTIAEAITYLLNRSTTEDNSHLLSTLVGDTAYIRNIKKGKNIIGDNLFYDIISITDNRKRVDFRGGLKEGVVTDAEGIAEATNVFDGASEVLRKRFSALDDKNIIKAKARVKQARTYFVNYTVLIVFPGWLPIWGSTISVSEKDYRRTTVVDTKKLEPGKYFVSCQILTRTFSKSYETSSCLLQMVE